jgi:hypothetical protein
MSRKVFTAGEVLAAADVNSFLMDQTVMSFATSAARGSAIPTPTLGMYTHLEDSAPAPRLQFWNGSAWRSPFGQTLVATSTFSAQSQILLDNIFTSEFDNYKIVGSISGTTTTGINWQLRSGGSNLSTNTYSGVQINGYASATSTQIPAQGNGDFGLVRNVTKRNIFEATLTNPANALETMTQSAVYDSSSNGIAISHFQNTSALSYDGLRIFATTGTFTGSFQVYGLRV